MPKEIDAAFRRAAGASSRHGEDLQTDCSCPDWANPCKHVAAAHYVLGEAVDKDPFLLFELRGRGKDDVLGALRKRRARAGGVAQPAGSTAASEPRPDRLARGPRPGRSSAAGPLGTAALPHRAARCDGIEPPPARRAARLVARREPADLLAPVYQAAGALARDLALRPAEEEAAGALSRAGRKR